MKQCNYFCALFLSVCSFYVHANSELNIADCSLKNSPGCDIFLKMDRGDYDVSYQVQIADVTNQNKVFPFFDMNETTESVSLQKYGEKYVFSKEYLDNTKALEFIVFRYERKLVSDLKYYYIGSSIDFKNNEKRWAGKECETSTGNIPAGNEIMLLSAASRLCLNQMKLSFNSSENSQGDVLFNISQTKDGDVQEEIPVIALDSKKSDNINLSDIGCLSNCVENSKSISYIGKLNGKIRVGLHLHYNGESVSGYYFYKKMKKAINVSGHLDGNKLMLLASVPNGMEEFEGKLENGQFKGCWVNAERSKKYSFILYMMLIQ